MTQSALTAEQAAQFAEIALGHVEREYPNNLDHCLAKPEDARTPRDLHPVFYGSFDWHSCVHSYWMLARLLRRFPDIAQADKIRSLFDRQFVAEKVAAERDYFMSPSSKNFKRPYGWGWLLKLAAELVDAEDLKWSANLKPLSTKIVESFQTFLPIATYPVRVGTHFNTAFGLRMAADYASAAGDEKFMSLLVDTARRWYGNDRDCPAWGEPSGDDFQSSALIEAECMRRLLPAPEFQLWLDGFLPRLGEHYPETLFRPATVSDRTDGKIAHLDGLNLSRAWCWRSLASTFAANDTRREIAETCAAKHLEAGLPHLAVHYMGEHWLASFAVLAIDERNGVAQQN